MIIKIVILKVNDNPPQDSNAIWEIFTHEALSEKNCSWKCKFFTIAMSGILWCYGCWKCVTRKVKIE